MPQINPVRYYKMVIFHLSNIGWIGCNDLFILWVLDGLKLYQALR